MAINKKCPKCGSTKVQMSQKKSKHGLLWAILFGVFWLMWIFCKWCIGAMIWMFYDWWMAIVKKNQGKGYNYVSAGWFKGSKTYYYCHDCSHNFKG